MLLWMFLFFLQQVIIESLSFLESWLFHERDTIFLTIDSLVSNEQPFSVSILLLKYLLLDVNQVTCKEVLRCAKRTKAGNLY